MKIWKRTEIYINSFNAVFFFSVMAESQVTSHSGARLNVDDVDDDTLKGRYAETLRAYKVIAYPASIEGTSARRINGHYVISFFTRIAWGAHGLISTNELACFILVFFEN